MRFGLPELLLLALIALVFFGPKRLPEIGKALGRALTEFRAGLRADSSSDPPADPQR